MKYIATFFYRYRYHNFALTEFISICEMLGIKNLKIGDDFSYNCESEPYMSLTFDGIDDPQICEKIVSRAVLLRNIVKVYGEGETMDEVVSNIKIEEIKPEMESEDSFKFEVDIRRANITQEERVALMEKLDNFKFRAKANLSKPKRIFVIFQNNNIDGKKFFFFGKQLAGKDDKDVRFFTKYELMNRKYLGPTSTDHILAFIMTNCAQIKENDFIIDPFVGTGSLIIPPAHFGANVFGCDVDIRVLRGYSVGYVRKEKKTVKKEANIFTNFDVYGLPRPQIIRQDINTPTFKKNNIFDAIICDPPYGYRAGSKKTGLGQEKKEKREKRISMRKKEHEKKEDEDEDEDDDEDDFNPDYVNYNGEKRLFLPLKKCAVSQIFESLINFANICLKKGGLLVCLYPTKKTEEEKDMVHLPINFPSHPNFQLQHACENKYSVHKSRWCLIYKKIN